MRYSISLILLTFLAVAALKGSLSFNGNAKTPLFLTAQQQQSGDADQYNDLQDDSTPPPGLTDEVAQYWNTLTPQQKDAVRQDIQNGMDPNQAVLNYAQTNNRQPANVEGEGSHSTSENYDEGNENFPESSSNTDLENTLNQQNSDGSKPKQNGNMSSNTTKAYSGSGSTEDDASNEDGVNSHNEGVHDPSNHTPSSSDEDSPAPGNEW